MAMEALIDAPKDDLPTGMMMNIRAMDEFRLPPLRQAPEFISQSSFMLKRVVLMMSQSQNQGPTEVLLTDDRV